MLEKFKNKIFKFIDSPKDVPVLAGISIGFYMILYYYSKNFSLANSWQQLAFFVAYYMLLPVVVLYAGFKILGVFKLHNYKRQFLFVGIALFMGFFLLQLSFVGSYKKPAFLAIAVLAIAASFWLKKYYKLFILLLFFMSVFNLMPIAQVVNAAVRSSSAWKQQPDNITNAVFKERPNIYYIQPDGYASFKNLSDSNHNFDNSVFQGFLKQSGFTLYDNFRSNYFSTLLSNSSMFSMKQHYIERDVNVYGARDIIVGNNAVLQVLKHNNYKTHFLTEKPYLLINRPNLAYDYCNIDYASLPYIKDGWEDVKDIDAALAKVIKPSESGNFYFIEKMAPGHIHGLKVYSEGVQGEKDFYFDKLKSANIWLTKTIKLIESKDPNALIIIGADHGGFVGLEYTGQSTKKINNPTLVRAVFGAGLAIKWNNPAFTEYDGGLKSSVNLFRTVFAFLAKDKKYLDNLQENGSYINMSDPQGLHRLIDNDGNVVLQRKQ
ncbi:hypothetical protein [Flavobacterium subsaxonicum]|uniref:Sulfatase N-terminal domain-containing protein n=1 Tax=Flavobacterium subsaxonicum WB 4.1-42 = DSM 21790 TaxID=1121898 RepID=A0A0A2MJW0_9FLAO|nr:hypothetical protein [Flavobacterium subsaxonicum]KGO92569.1 hypothetical protein Q766_12400 [Flavobacterium subsaxonicum WB 4.1-42 = DSM 21790]